MPCYTDSYLYHCSELCPTVDIALELCLTARYPKVQLGNRRVYITTGHVWNSALRKEVILGLNYQICGTLLRKLCTAFSQQISNYTRKYIYKNHFTTSLFHLSLVKPLKPEEEIIPNPTQHKRVSYIHRGWERLVVLLPNPGEQVQGSPIHNFKYHTLPIMSKMVSPLKEASGEARELAAETNYQFDITNAHQQPWARMCLRSPCIASGH